MSAAATAIEHVAAWAWRASWQGAVLAVVVAVVLKVVGRRLSPGWRFALWGLVLVRMAVPAVVGVSWWGGRTAGGERTALLVKTELPTPNVQHSTSNPRITASVPRRDPSVDVERSKSDVGRSAFIPTVSAEASPWNWRRVRAWATWAWLAGVIVLAGRVVWASARLARAVRRMAVVTDPRVLDVLRACCAEAGIKRVPTVRLLPAGGGPALVGVWRPAILLPPEVVEGMAAEQLRLILLHELGHVRRWDVLVNWLGTLVAVVHWPNPAAWLVLERMRYERELACDEFVLGAGRGAGRAADRGAYARTIVGLAEALSSGRVRSVAAAGGAAGLVGILEGRTQLQRRLQMIARFDATAGRRWPVVAAGLGLVIGAAALSGVTRAAADEPAGAPGRPPAIAPPAPAPRPAGPPGAPAPTPAPPRLPGVPGMPGMPGEPALAPPPLAPAAVKPTAPAVKDGRVVDDGDPANARTAEKLQKPVKIEFQNNSFSDVLDFVRDQAGVDILVQWPQLEQAGLDRNAPVTLRLREPTPVGSVLSLLFRTLPVRLNYEIDKGVVVIGAAEAASPEVTRVYDVSDLVMFRGEVAPGGGVPGGAGLPPPGAGGFAGPGPGAPMAVVVPDEVAQLTHLIQTTVQPDTWREAGGPSGSITSFKGKLVIKATEPVHKEVAQLLEMLRETPGGKKAK